MNEKLGARGQDIWAEEGGSTSGEVTELSSEEKREVLRRGPGSLQEQERPGRKNSVWGPLVGRPETHWVLLGSKEKVRI